MFWANHKGGPAWNLTGGQTLQLQWVEFGEQVIQAPSPFVAGGDGVVVMDKEEYLRLLADASINNVTKFRIVQPDRPKCRGRPPKHYHPRVEEHKNSSSSIGKHFRDKHSLAPKDLTKNFSVLMKCTNKFDCLVYEMFFIHELRPTLNVQSDSIRAKVFN